MTPRSQRTNFFMGNKIFHVLALIMESNHVQMSPGVGLLMRYLAEHEKSEKLHLLTFQGP